ncbi:MFS transporter [Paraburkholderia caribensis]|uniref:MFS transporter n=1 Tax=Paraburkholderia caribensis TaxID=75105 RepID=A0A9Q6S6X2_9BURK|nr:MFS transporter [Paraburkholderia caribensis]MCO4876938.1 MFS transporter [Paraburkholderia caribensis]PTB30712.1 MFS transporter [Paraburkholderia caribensis]QLB65616.1 MFS transporter [Paraburkholderia caribensis]
MFSAKSQTSTSERRKVIVASSLGTMFEWYDFYLYGSLSAIIARQFFSGVNSTAAFIFALLAFAAGFIVRPFGSLVFGVIGDIAGRKRTFLVTIVLMGLPTFIVGLLPSYDTLGIASPILLIALRLLQGLAVGGEYGGAVTYVAEHSSSEKRGFHTSWLQTTGTLGLLLSLFVILGVRTGLGEDSFTAWGWRLPFLFSIVLLGLSLWIRVKLSESPEFKRMQEKGEQSKSPLRDTFGNSRNRKLVITSLLGCTAGLGVVAYTGQFYIQFFLLQAVKLDGKLTNEVLTIALVLCLPLYVLFGWLSDRIGRKPVILAGCAVAALTYFPIYKGIMHYANPALEHAQAISPVRLETNLSDCSFQFNPVGTSTFNKSCDIAKAALAKNTVNYTAIEASGNSAVITVGNQRVELGSLQGVGAPEIAQRVKSFNSTLSAALIDHGYPQSADPSAVNMPMLILLIMLPVIYLTMVYSPTAAWLVELFPPQIRYTATSLPYNIGNGWFGGFMPATAFAMVAATGDIYFGLWYPVIVAGAVAVIGFFFLPESRFMQRIPEVSGEPARAKP